MIDQHHRGVFFEVSDGPSNLEFLSGAVFDYCAATGVTPDRITTSRKDITTKILKRGQLEAAFRDQGTHYVTVWKLVPVGSFEIALYLRPFDRADQRFQTRHVSIISPSPGSAIDQALLALLRSVSEVYPVAHGSAGRYRSIPYASREVMRSTTNVSAIDAGTARRLHEDAMSRGKRATHLRRLYPITIIGPAIWAQLPPMPAFDPMPTVEELGDCKIVTAWPELCDPRDPAFLRGTRALREWLWPYTIQNPADHVDNDPPCADVAT